MSHMPPRYCFCCKQPWSMSGCLRGPICGCIFERGHHCWLCQKCLNHCPHTLEESAAEEARLRAEAYAKKEVTQ